MSHRVLASEPVTICIISQWAKLLAKICLRILTFINQPSKAYIFFLLTKAIVKVGLAENTANDTMESLKKRLSCLGLVQAINQGKSPEEAIEAGNKTRSAFYSSMRALQEQNPDNLLLPTPPEVLKKCAYAMQNCTKTVDELLFEIRELLHRHLKASADACNNLQKFCAIVEEHKLFFTTCVPNFGIMYHESLEIKVFARQIHAAVCEDVQRWKDENPLQMAL